MKVLFIYPDICIASGRFQEGIGYMSAVLKKAGHSTSLLHIEKELSRKELWDSVGSFAPDLIGFSATTNQYPYVEQYAGWVKERFDVPIVCGGIHPTMSPEEVIADKHIDMVCIGGEYPPGVGRRAGKRQEYLRNKKPVGERGGDSAPERDAPLIANLDELPFPTGTFRYGDMLEKFSSRAEGKKVGKS